VPIGVIVLAHDVGIRRYVELEDTIIRWTDVDRGGHSAALEEPETLVGRVRAFLQDRRSRDHGVPAAPAGGTARLTALLHEEDPEAAVASRNSPA
jgi:hypothetical protein